MRGRRVWLSACALAVMACSSPSASPGGSAGGGADGGPADGGGDSAADGGADAGGRAAATYIKASNAGTQETFGNAVAISADGSTLAVGALGQVSVDNGAGTVYVFVRVGGRWSQQALIKPSNTGPGDYFGMSVALSDDGGTLAVGANLEDSNATGVGGDQGDDPALGIGFNAGAAYVFTRAVGGTWSQQAYIKASNTGRDYGFGQSVALSGDGATLAVGAPFEDSGATGIDGNQADDSAPSAGAAYVFARGASGTWSQQAYVKASNTAA